VIENLVNFWKFKGSKYTLQDSWAVESEQKCEQAGLATREIAAGRPSV
jgi:hypothetical protein